MTLAYRPVSVNEIETNVLWRTWVGETFVQVVFTGGTTVACPTGAQVHVDLGLGAGPPVEAGHTGALVDVNLTVGSAVAWHQYDRHSGRSIQRNPLVKQFRHIWLTVVIG